MDRLLTIAFARMIHRIAAEAILFGQNIIRGAYRCQQAAFRWHLNALKCHHVTTPTEVRSQWPSGGAPRSSDGGL